MNEANNQMKISVLSTLIVVYHTNLSVRQIEPYLYQNQVKMLVLYAYKYLNSIQYLRNNFSCLRHQKCDGFRGW